MKKYLSWIVSGILLIALGIFMLIMPASVLKVAVIAFGAYTILEGLFSFIASFSVRKLKNIFMTSMIKALVNLFIGILVIYLAASSSASTVADWVVYLIAANLLLSALAELIEDHIIRKAGLMMFGLSNGAVLSLIFALIMFLFPQFVNATFFTILAVILIVAGICAILWTIRLIRVIGAVRKSEKVAEAEFEEKN